MTTHNACEPSESAARVRPKSAGITLSPLGPISQPESHRGPLIYLKCINPMITIHI